MPRLALAIVMASALAGNAIAQDAAQVDAAQDDAAQADAAPDPAALSQEGMLLFLDSDYAGALDRWQRAYAITNDPELLPNIAQALGSLSRYAKALETNLRALE